MRCERGHVVETKEGRGKNAGPVEGHIHGKNRLAGGRAMLPRKLIVEETVIAGGSLMMEVLRDGGLSGAIEQQALAT